MGGRLTRRGMLLGVLLRALLACVLAVGLAPVRAWAAVDVADPRVVADGSMTSGQLTTWDCVWLGSYPQTYVDDAALVAKLDAATGWVTKRDTATGWDADDLVLNGVTYRRLAKGDATSPGRASDASSSWDWSSKASSAGYCYFRWEPVKWRVLEADDATATALVVSDVALDGQKFNHTSSSATWETCTLRGWLQRMFLSSCLTTAEQGAVVQQELANIGNSTYGTSGGANTADAIFLLAESDVWSGEGAMRHGFATSGGAYDEARRCRTSDYAHAMGASRALPPTAGGPDYYSGNCDWWLRTRGRYENYACFTLSSGKVNCFGDDQNRDNNAVRPAMRISLSSDQVAYAGTVSSNGDVDEASVTDIGDAEVTLRNPLFTQDGVACYKHTGSQVRPGVTVKLDGKILAEGTDYAVSYGDNTDYGEGSVAVTGAGDYTGSVAVKFKIVPGKVEGLRGKKGLADEQDSGLAYANYRRKPELEWDALPGGRVSYEVSLSKSSDFSGAKTYAVTNATLTEADSEEPLDRDSLYYARVRAKVQLFAMVDGVGGSVEGPWSDTLRVRTGKQILCSEMWEVRNSMKDLKESDMYVTSHDFREVFDNGLAQAVFEFRYQPKRTNEDGSEAAYQAGVDNTWYQIPGYCRGMIMTGIAYHEYGAPPRGSYIEGVSADNYATVRSSSYGLSWLQTVRYASLTQDGYDNCVETDLNTLDLPGLYEAVRECQRGKGDPVDVFLKETVREDGKEVKYAHEVLAVGIKEDTPAQAVIEVYDPNRGKHKPWPLYLNKDASGNFIGWSFLAHFGDDVLMDGLVATAVTKRGREWEYIDWVSHEGAIVADVLNQINETGDANLRPGTIPGSTQSELMTVSNLDESSAEQLDELASQRGYVWVPEISGEAGGGSSSGTSPVSLAYWVPGDEIDIPNVPANATVTLAYGARMVRVTTKCEGDVHVQIPDEGSASISVTPHSDGTYEALVYDSDSETSDAQRTELGGALASGRQLLLQDHDGVVDVSGTGTLTVSKVSGTENDDLTMDDPVETELEADSLDGNSTYRFSGEGNESNLRILGDDGEPGDVIAWGTGTDIASLGKDIMNATVSVKKLTYSNNDQVPSVTVTLDGTKLTKGKDYTLSGDLKVCYVGTYVLTVTGIGDYRGSQSITYEVQPLSIVKLGTNTLNKRFMAGWPRALYYNGKVQHYHMELGFDGSMLALDEGTDYTVEASGKAIGPHPFIIRGVGNFTGAYRGTFIIYPTGTKLTKARNVATRRAQLKWKRNKNVTGYQIQYATRRDFKGARTVTIKKNTVLSKTLAGLKMGKTYYVRIRTYKTVSKKKYTSDWGAVKKVKIAK